MNKTIIASAIAATLLSTSAFAAEMPTISGNIQLAWTHSDSDVNGGGTSGLVDNGSTIRFSHSHQINDELEGFLKIEFDGVNADDKSGAVGTLKLDEAYVGVKGSFGKVWVGSDDSVYEQFIDKGNDFEALGVATSDNYTTGEGDLVQFVSSSMEGFQVFAAVELDASDDDRSNAFQVGVAYSADALTVALGMDSNDTAGDDAKSTFGVSATYTMDNLKLVGSFHTRDNVSDIAIANAIYTAGANQYVLSLSHTSEENDDKTSVVGVQALHNLSSNMYVYAEAAFFNMEESDSTDVAVGVTYFF
ncbi:MAG: porin [Gammaproteobacteria bacterium]|nr:porin [Gammaproteobacteria bacterium]